MSRYQGYERISTTTLLIIICFPEIANGDQGDTMIRKPDSVIFQLVGNFEPGGETSL
jgi:hypothetical protein